MYQLYFVDPGEPLDIYQLRKRFLSRDRLNYSSDKRVQNIEDSLEKLKMMKKEWDYVLKDEEKVYKSLPVDLREEYVKRRSEELKQLYKEHLERYQTVFNQEESAEILEEKKIETGPKQKDAIEDYNTVWDVPGFRPRFYKFEESKDAKLLAFDMMSLDHDGFFKERQYEFVQAYHASQRKRFTGDQEVSFPPESEFEQQQLSRLNRRFIPHPESIWWMKPPGEYPEPWSYGDTIPVTYDRTDRDKQPPPVDHTIERDKEDPRTLFRATDLRRSELPFTGSPEEEDVIEARIPEKYTTLEPKNPEQKPLPE
eukprot:TRINITY_DN4281_c0_g1_i1.p1 TRINITY_DN4281_c0_g1~~TRINITY_DN4281_c0_g1_i1.p1  ORF type:complete len:311 (+),score=66.91 TRINITY_DN4281_c0_g1_i1:675-1607(+)